MPCWRSSEPTEESLSLLCPGNLLLHPDLALLLLALEGGRIDASAGDFGRWARLAGYDLLPAPDADTTPEDAAEAHRAYRRARRVREALSFAFRSAYADMAAIVRAACPEPGLLAVGADEPLGAPNRPRPG